jgi:hypothetical protein
MNPTGVRRARGVIVTETLFATRTIPARGALHSFCPARCRNRATGLYREQTPNHRPK